MDTLEQPQYVNQDNPSFRGSDFRSKKPKRSKKMIGGLFLLVVIVGIGFIGWWLWQKGGLPALFPPTPAGVAARFTLEPSDSDTAGISPQTLFILKSSQRLGEKEVKNIVRFNPEVSFTVKDISKRFSVIPAVLAQTQGQGSEGEESQGIEGVFEITPQEPLQENEIYQITISDLDYAEREYSWAFQVKAQFQVIKTNPADKATNVPVNSGIEITFNREGLINPQGYFEISPEVAGSFEYYGNTLVFLPNELAKESIYTVTVRRGLKTQGSNDILFEDYSFAFETQSEPYSSSQPSFDFYSEFEVFLPARKPIMPVSIYNTESPEHIFSADIYKLGDLAAFLTSYKNSRAWNLTWGYYYRSKGIMFNPEKAQKVLSFEPQVLKVQWQQFMELPTALEQGYYVLDVYNSVRKEHNYLWFQVSPISYYYSITYGKGLLWLYDFKDRQPLSEATVSLFESQSSNSRTNSQGLAEFVTPANLRADDENPQDPRFFTITKEGYLPLLIKVGGYSSYYYSDNRASKGDLYWTFLSTERPAYQTSDTVHYWGVLKGREQDLRQKKVRVGIYSGFYFFGSEGSQEEKNALVSGDVLVSPFNTIQGELSFEGLTPGYYNLVIQLGDETVSTTNFQVLSYTKPAYQISVTPSRRAVFAGDKLDFKVQAKFFDGTPVSKLKVAHQGYWHGRSEPLTGTLTLDENGEGTFSYTAEYYESDYDYWPQSLYVYFSPALAEEGDISAQANVWVFGPNVHPQAFQEHQEGQVYKFTAKANEIVLEGAATGQDEYWRGEEGYIGKPVSNQPLSAELIETTYTEIETGQYYDPIDKVVRKQYEYQKHEKVIRQFQGTTDSQGEWSFVAEIPQKEDSSYRVRFFGKDNRQRKLEASVSPWRSVSATDISLTVNQNDYYKGLSVGEEVNLELEVPEGLEVISKVLFYRYQNNLDGVWIRPDLTFQETFRESFVPSVTYQAVILTSSGFKESNSVRASLKETDQRLIIDISPDKESYRPGEEIAVNLHIKDIGERPVPAQVNIAVVDEALFHILPYSWEPQILETLYHNIAINPLTGFTRYYEKGSLESAVPGGGAEMGGCFLAGTSVLMSDGATKPIEKVRIGDEVLTLESGENPASVSAIVQGISEHLVDSYFIINNSLKVTGEHKIFLNNTWQHAGLAKTGDWLLKKGGVLERVFSIEKINAPQTAVYNIIVDKYHTYIADGYFVHNEEKGGTPRLDFLDVALYDTVSANNNGDASFRFKAPDNITSWRTTALAFSAEEMKAGQATKLIPVSLPFFVDASLSNYYLVGDSPVVRLRAFGTSYQQGKEIDFSLKSETLGLDEKENTTSNTAYFSLGKLSSEGNHTLTFSASQGNLSDALVRKIEVVKSYFRVGQSSLYDLSEGLSGIESNQGGFTRLVFADKGRGKFYSVLNSHSYSSGIRIDQTATKYIAQELLRDYFEESWSEEPLDLSGYHTKEGGIGLFPYSDSDLELSAKTADLASRFIFKDQLREYFAKSLSDKKAGIDRISQALYGLACLKEPILNKINSLKQREDLTLEDKVYLALALAKLGDKEASRAFYESDIRPGLRFQGSEAWIGQEEGDEKVKLTATIAVLVSYLNIKQDSQELWQYISTHNPAKDLDSFEELLFIRNELANLPLQKAKFSFQTSQRKEKVILEPGRVYAITLPEDELKTIRFDNIEGEIGLISFYERSKDSAELAKNSELGLTRTYLVSNKQRHFFDEGETVLVRLDPTIAPSAIDGQYQLIDYLPSGLRPITQTYKRGLSWGEECNPLWYPFKVLGNVVYFEIDKNFDKTNKCHNRTVNYYARVVSGGDYIANPAVIQSAKDLESLNFSSSDLVEIK